MEKQTELLKDMVSLLKQQRDEMRVKLHLAKAEAKEEYERLSGQIGKLEDQFEPVREATVESAENVANALLLAAEELKNGLLRIRKSISEAKD